MEIFFRLINFIYPKLRFKYKLSIAGEKIAMALEQILARRGANQNTEKNGTHYFICRAGDLLDDNSKPTIRIKVNNMVEIGGEVLIEFLSKNIGFYIFSGIIAFVIFFKYCETLTLDCFGILVFVVVLFRNVMYWGEIYPMYHKDFFNILKSIK